LTLEKRGRTVSRLLVVVVATCLMATLAVAQQAQRVDKAASAAGNANGSTAEPRSGLVASAPRRPEVVAESPVAAQEAPIPDAKAERAKEQREHADLVAQQEMAYWAQAMTYATGASVGVSAIATWFLFRTFRLTRVSSEKQLRAYLTVSAVEMNFPKPGMPWPTVLVRNGGQTPALEVTTWIHQWIELFPLMVALPEPINDDYLRGKDVLGPGGQLFLNPSGEPRLIVKREEDIGIIGTPCGTIYIYGRIDYRDVFGNPQHTVFRYMYGGRTRVTGKRCSPCEGNEAT
jgi:hypothetical protein